MSIFGIAPGIVNLLNHLVCHDMKDCFKDIAGVLIFIQTMFNLFFQLSNLFIQPLDYTIYHQNLIFENNIRGTRTV
jgi:hypothetical protein